MGLVTELAVILIAAGIFTIISKALKQPLILGYIIAGFIVSPNLGLLPELGGTEAVKEWSDIGIIFLLFALGLEFSFKKLLKVGSSALITACTICVGMFIVGIIAGQAMGWTMMESIFLGGLMSMSSTTIILKAYDDMGLKRKPYATVVFGTLVVEDLIAVLLMVLLSTLAVSKKFSGGEMFWSLAKLAFYLILWFLCGIYFIPSILKKCRKWLNDEILLVLSIGLCFVMVVLANAAGFSSALGAFVMGSILAETLEGEKISHLMSNIKDLFGAIFFVSVGMMINPAVIAEHWLTILFITLVAMGGLMLFSMTGILLAGKGLDTAVHAGFTFAQLGEFSFIIASLGCSLGVMRDFIYPMIIAVSVITTFTTPYMIKASDPVYRWLQKHLPDTVLKRLSPREEDTSVSIAEHGEWKTLLKSYFLRIILYGVIILAVLLFSEKYLDVIVRNIIPGISDTACNIVNFGVTMVFLLPLMYGLSIPNGGISPSVSKLLKEKPSNRWPILSLMVLRVALSVFILTYVVLSHFTLGGWYLLWFVVVSLALFFTCKFTMHRYSGLEEHFLRNFNEKEEEMKRMAPVTSSVKQKLSSYNVHTEAITISPDFAFIGQSLRNMPFRKESSANIIKIVRGSLSVVIPSGDEVLYPGDKLVVVGTGSQLELFKKIINDNTVSYESVPDDDFALESFAVQEESYINDKSLRELSMRSHGCMVICVLRDDEFITNPHAEFRFRPGDLVWIAGDSQSCKWYM